jgi:hypothetical protein
MTSILALSPKMRGRGPSRHYFGFIFDTEIQSAVELFMERVHWKDYFLAEPAWLKQVPEMGNYIYDDHWVCATHVHVKIRGKRTTFTITD